MHGLDFRGSLSELKSVDLVCEKNMRRKKKETISILSTSNCRCNIGVSVSGDFVGLFIYLLVF